MQWPKRSKPEPDEYLLSENVHSSNSFFLLVAVQYWCDVNDYSLEHNKLPHDWWEHQRWKYTDMRTTVETHTHAVHNETVWQQQQYGQQPKTQANYFVHSKNRTNKKPYEVEHATIKRANNWYISSNFHRPNNKQLKTFRMNSNVANRNNWNITAQWLTQKNLLPTHTAYRNKSGEDES